MSVLTKRLDTDVPKNTRLYGTDANGNIIPIVTDAAGGVSIASGAIVVTNISATITLESGAIVLADFIAISSGNVYINSGTVIAKTSGETVSVASGVSIIWRGVTVSGSVQVSGAVSISGNAVIGKISGETVVVASGIESIWRPLNLSGLVTNSYIKSPIDVVDGAIITITNKDYRIHNGNFFKAGQYTVSAGTVSGVVLHMLTPASLAVHTVYTVESDVAGLVELYENPTITVSGTVIFVLNRNRGGLTSSTTLVFSQPNYTSGTGTLLARRYNGTYSKDSTPGGAVTGLAEWIFKSGTNYILKFVPEATPSHVNLRFDWSEV